MTRRLPKFDFSTTDSPEGATLVSQGRKPLVFVPQQTFSPVRATVFRVPSRRTFARAFSLALIAIALGQVSARAVDVVVKSAGADVRVGRLISFSLETGLTLELVGDSKPLHIDTADLVRIETAANPIPPSPAAMTIQLTGGDRLIGTPGIFERDRVDIVVPSLGIVTVPLERLESWSTPHARDKRWHEVVATMLADRTAGTDRLLLTNGDRLYGVIAKVDWQGFTVQTPLGLSRIAHDRVVAAAIVTAPLPPQDGLWARIELVDGSRLTSRAVQWSGGTMLATVLDGQPQQIPSDRIKRVELSGGQWRWLTELTPSGFSSTPVLSLDWPYKTNRNVLGGMLRVAGQSFEHGLGVHAKSVLTYDLEGRYRRFVTFVGIDDDAGPLADVSLSIRIDGRTHWQQKHVRQGKLIGPVAIDTVGARSLELIVDFGKLGGIQDRLNWIEPVLIR